MQRAFYAILSAAMLTCLPAGALNVADAFVKAPRSVIPLIEETTRLDMIDYFNAGSERASRNILYGKSRITSLTPDHMTVETTAASTLEIVALPAGSDTVLAVISTVATPVPDSKLTLYTSSWEPLDPKRFSPPGIEQWLAPGASRDEVEALLPFMLSSCSYDAASQAFVFTNRSAEFLSDEVYEPVKPLLRDTLTYEWDGKRLTPRK